MNMNINNSKNESIVPRYGRAKWGSNQGIDRKMCQKMLGFLHGRITGGDKEKAAEAKETKSIYASIADPQEKNEFLQDFFGNGGGKSAGGLKFALKWRKRIECCDSQSVGFNENYWTRPMILQKNGMSLRDFSSQEEALATADDLVARNMSENEYTFENHPAMIDKNPLLSRFYYIETKGKDRVWKMDQLKSLDKGKELKNIGDVQAHMEEALGAGMDPVKDEFPEWKEVQKLKDALKATLKNMETCQKTARMQMAKLKLKMVKEGKHSDNTRVDLEKFKGCCDEFDDFVLTVNMTLADVEARHLYFIANKQHLFEDARLEDAPLVDAASCMISMSLLCRYIGASFRGGCFFLFLK